MGNIGYQQSKTNPEQVTNWNEQQQGLFDLLSQFLKGGTQSPVPKYPGQTYVPETEQEKSYFDWVNQSADARRKALEQISSGTVPYKIGPEWAENYYESGVRQPYLREFENVVLPQLRESYSGPGYWGGARAEAETKATEDFATTLGAKKAELMYGEELAKRQAEESALNRQAVYGPAAWESESNIMGTAGQYRRAIEQEKVMGDLQRWLMGETVDGVTPTQYNPFLQLLFQALGLTPFSYGESGNMFGFDFGVNYSKGD